MTTTLSSASEIELVGDNQEQKIIKKNLELMTSLQDGSMPNCLNDESVGARGQCQGHSYALVNFYFDKKTGEIKYFGNCQDVPGEFRNYSHGVFKLAFIRNGNSVKNKIVYRSQNTIQPHLEKIFDQIIKTYNKEHGGRI